MKYFVRSALHALPGLAVLLLSGNTSASLVFSEDFESYAAGSDLRGQGGWFGGGGPMLVGTGGPLPTHILDGVGAAPPGR